jgi:hypothetical protein
MKLETFLKEYYKLPNNNTHITLLDLIIIKIDFPKYQYNLKSLKNLNYIDNKIINIETNNKRYLLHLLSQTHFSNYISDLKQYIDGMISDNITELNQILLNRLYSNILVIKNLDLIIINNFETILNKKYPLSDEYNLILFYNKELIKKFIESLDIIKPNINNNIINEIYDTLIETSKRLIKYLRILMIKIKDSNKYGLSNFNPELYLFYLNYYVGLNFKNLEEVKYLYKWSYKYLKYNLKKSDKIKKKLDFIDNNFKSKEEMINLYQNKLNEMSNIVNIYDIPNTTKCILKTYSNINGSGAQYFNNCFYLNIYNWENENKYTIRSLVMHEAYPGHHMQMDILNNFHEYKYLFIIYGDLITSFAEGWGLFAEKIHSYKNNFDDYGQYNMDCLRILRIIADIDLHLFNKPPQYVINKLLKYLPDNINNINAEVYRYLVLPGQAVSYKIGETVFMSIYKKYKEKIDSKFMYEIYKNILLNSIPFLDDLLNEYDMTFFNL